MLNNEKSKKELEENGYLSNISGNNVKLTANRDMTLLSFGLDDLALSKEDGSL